MSFIKSNKLNKVEKIDNSKKVEITGAISRNKNITLGTVQCQIQLDEHIIEQEFHLVRDKLNISTDGILGSNFFRKNKCKIDYENLTIDLVTPIQNRTTQTENNSSLTPSYSKQNIGETLTSIEKEFDLTNIEKESEKNIYEAFIGKISYEERIDEIEENKNIKTIDELKLATAELKTRPDNVILKARTENIVEVAIDEKNEVVIEKQEIENGIIIGNAVVLPKNGKAKIAILNVNTKDFVLDTNSIELKTRKLSEFKILSINYERDKVENRLIELKRLIKLDHCNQEEHESIWELCRDYNHLFYLKGDRLSATSSVTHKIQLLPGTEPINLKPYRLPHSQKEEVEKQVKELLAQGIIAPSKSPWNTPILLVAKKPDAQGIKKWRLVVDFRQLNEKTVTDSYPLPNITDILDQLGRSVYFTTLDLASGYWQVRMDETSQEYTAFQANYKFYEWKRMPFGLKNAPSTFQRLMNEVLTGLQGVQCLVYLDDIVIYGKTLYDHNEKLKNVFDRLEEYNLKLQPEKCQFMCREINYLGHIISKDGILPDPKKIRAVQQFPLPKTVRQIKSFLGLASYYRRFIKNFSKLAEPMNKLLKKGEPFKWDAKCDESFSTLKEKLTTPPILAFPILDQEYRITTDASQTAVGAVLSQEHQLEDEKADLPICYMSRTLNQAERKYAVIEKELLAIVYALKQFRPYVYGRKCLIITDHKPLVWLMKLKNPSSRLMRWKLELSEYDLDIIHKPGILNANADALSRIEITPQEILGTEHIQNKVEMKYPEPESSINIVTRSQTRRQQDIEEIEQYEIKSEEDKKTIIPEEEINRLVKKHFDYIIYLISHSNDQINETIQMNNIFDEEIGKLHEYKKNELVIYLPDKCGKETDSINIKTVGKQIVSLCEKNGIKNLAIRLPKYEPEFYVHFKQNIEKEIEAMNVKIKFFIDTVICIKDDKEKEVIIKSYHELPLGGHLGITNTISKIRQNYFWPKMNEDIINYVSKCIICKKTKVTTHTKLPMKIISPATRVYQKLHMDIVGPIAESELGNKYILTFQDDLSKYAEAIPMSDATAYTVAESFVTTIICRHGIPETLVTDQGTVFMSNMFQQVCKILKINHITTSAYRPQSNGQIERYHRSLAQYIKAFIETDYDNWDKLIPFGLMVYNTTRQTSTNYTPHELVYGFNIDIPTNLKIRPTVTYNYDDYITLLKNRLRYAHELARENILKSKDKSKEYYDRNVKYIKFEVGDMVLVQNEVKAHKFAPPYLGPYPIVEILSDETSLIQIGRKTKRFHNNKLKLAKENTVE